MTTSKNFATRIFVFFAFSDNSCSADLISQSTHYYRKQFLTVVLCACATLPSRLSTVGDSPPPLPPPDLYHSARYPLSPWCAYTFCRKTCSSCHLARHSERWKTTRQTEEEVGRQHQGMDRRGVREVPEGSGERKNGGDWVQNHLRCPNDPCG